MGQTPNFAHGSGGGWTVDLSSHDQVKVPNDFWVSETMSLFTTARPPCWFPACSARKSGTLDVAHCSPIPSGSGAVGLLCCPGTKCPYQQLSTEVQGSDHWPSHTSYAAAGQTIILMQLCFRMGKLNSSGPHLSCCSCAFSSASPSC